MGRNIYKSKIDICIDCGYKKLITRQKRCAACDRIERSEYLREYQNNWVKEQNAQLTDYYMKTLLRKKGIKTINASDELIQLMRSLQQIKRAISAIKDDKMTRFFNKVSMKGDNQKPPLNETYNFSMTRAPKTPSELNEAMGEVNLAMMNGEISILYAKNLLKNLAIQGEQLVNSACVIIKAVDIANSSLSIEDASRLLFGATDKTKLLMDKEES